MGKPQQPEVRRSGFNAALDPDATGSELEAQKRPGADPATGPVPDDNRPGHQPDEVQDKPSGDAFVAKARKVAKKKPAAKNTAAKSTAAKNTAAKRIASKRPAAKRTAATKTPASAGTATGATRTSAPTSDDPVVPITSPGTTTPAAPRKAPSSPVETGLRIGADLALTPWRIGAGVVRHIRRRL